MPDKTTVTLVDGEKTETVELPHYVLPGVFMKFAEGATVDVSKLDNNERVLLGQYVDSTLLSGGEPS